LSAMPYLLTQTRAPSGLMRLGAAIVSVESCRMDGFQRLHLLLAKAWRADQLRDTDSARRLIEEAVCLMDTLGAGSTIAVRILVGAGILHVEEGSYQAAVPLLQRAVGMAKKIDNALHFSAAAAALALAEGRLGHTNQQLRWAQAAIEGLPVGDAGIVALTAVYEKGLALIFDERSIEAVSLLSDTEPRFGRQRSSWAMQAWKLMKADILALAGETRKAFVQARQATSGRNEELLVNDFAGPFMRWKALVAIREGTAAPCVREAIRQLGNLERFHAKDQVEILASIALLEAELGIDTTDRRKDVERRLRALPNSIRILIKRLGVLPEHGEAEGTARGQRTPPTES